MWGCILRNGTKNILQTILQAEELQRKEVMQKQSLVYAIKFPRFVKVGCSSNFEARLYALEQGMKEKCQEFMTFECDDPYLIETVIKTHLIEYRVIDSLHKTETFNYEFEELKLLIQTVIGSAIERRCGLPSMTCPVCGDKFNSIKSAVYCSSKCRLKAWRKQKPKSETSK